MTLQRQPSSLSPNSSLSSRPALSTSSSDSSNTSASSLDTPFRNLSLHDPKPQRPQGFKEDEDLLDLQELYSQDFDMLQRQDSWDARNRDVAFAAPPSSSSPRFPTSSRSENRPTLPRRDSSFSKRNASFDSPREVPLPYMPSRVPEHASHTLPPVSSSSSQDGDSAGHPVLVLRPSSPSFNSTQHIDKHVSSEGYSNSMTAGSASPSAFQQPLELKAAPPSPAPHYMNTSEDPVPPLRTQRSFTGAPITPFSRPYSSGDTRIMTPQPMHAVELPDRMSTASLPLPAHTPFHTLPSVPNQTITEGQEIHMDDYPPDMSADAPAGPNRGWGVINNTNINRSPSPRSPTHPPSNRQTRSPPPRPAAADWTQFTDAALSAAATSPAFHPYPRAGSRRTLSPPSSSSGSSQTDLPPPTPPTILTPPLPEERDPLAPHVPFLSHGPPSRETYIAVETLGMEYRLHVQLPGYRRDAITLSTRKRRILHLVADSWEPEGGHFERRIVFGYDADLAQVRAEFDGELLRVIVPRRVQTPMTYWSSTRD